MFSSFTSTRNGSHLFCLSHGLLGGNLSGKLGVARITLHRGGNQRPTLHGVHHKENAARMSTTCGVLCITGSALYCTQMAHTIRLSLRVHLCLCRRCCFNPVVTKPMIQTDIFKASGDMGCWGRWDNVMHG